MAIVDVARGIVLLCSCSVVGRGLGDHTALVVDGIRDDMEAGASVLLLEGFSCRCGNLATGEARCIMCDEEGLEGGMEVTDADDMMKEETRLESGQR